MTTWRAALDEPTHAARTLATRPADAPRPTPSPAGDGLQVVAEGVTRIAGFGVAALSLVRDVDQLEVVAVAGDEDAAGALLGTRTTVASLEAEMEIADAWGALRFVPQERLDHLDPDLTVDGWVPELVPLEGPDAWHPLDLLCAPLLAPDGRLIGLLSMDLPRDGRRPGPAARRVLEEYARQAAHAALLTLQREELAEQVRLAGTAREIVRNASSHHGLAQILEETGSALVEGFGAAGMWIQVFDADDRGASVLLAVDGSEVVLPARLVRVAEAAARECWSRQRVEVIDTGRERHAELPAGDHAAVVAFLDSIGVGSIMFVPIGAGPECLGNLVLTRAATCPEWTDVQVEAVLDIGHDLGRVVLNARGFEREHRLVKELQALDVYKTRLIATVSHELKNPLTSVVGHLELLTVLDELPARATASLAAIGRGTTKLARVVDDLLLLSRVGDPERLVEAERVDLLGVVAEAHDLVRVEAQRREVALAPPLADGAPARLVVEGDADELERAVTNLLGNAVKYSPPGSEVQVVVRSRRTAGAAEVVVDVVDQGIGISAEDRGRLFEEFFRSTNPEALSRPGTGLGLAIVARIAAGHGGHVEVASELGRGSTFSLCLPAATP
ncbi:ATP-binding protein [Nocardioides sp. P86]|uniref:ATP-binding protein n=1 Tax=Nocardioides sp. P86 TaxID=2939569 RepID=UPI00203D8341|nr:ATP-binding protein [Nocardioides sp. P86]MCM3517026.1 ATP-binding protein [Nocardioides sp. P86]